MITLQLLWQKYCYRSPSLNYTSICIIICLELYKIGVYPTQVGLGGTEGDTIKAGGY